MTVMLFYSHKKKELIALKKLGNEVVCRLSDEDWDLIDYEDSEKLMNFLSKNPTIDISCVDVVADSGVGVAERLRSNNKNTYIILLADATVSPVVYIKPTIMAGSLMLRPLTADTVKKVFTEAVKDYIHRFRESDDAVDNFIIESREGKQFVPYDRIIFFESRNKKIYVNTENEEYCFYDTLDNIERNIGENFVRCHRSFIVSKARIKKIQLSQNTVLLDTGYQLPLSRSYKSVVKELR